MSGFIKYFSNNGKNMLFIVKDDKVLVEYSESWNNLKEVTSKKLHSEPIYNDKYIKTKVKTFNVVVHTIFHSKKIPNENMNYVYLAIITVYSIMKIDKKTTLKNIYKNASTL